MMEARISETSGSTQSLDIQEKEITQFLEAEERQMAPPEVDAMDEFGDMPNINEDIVTILQRPVQMAPFTFTNLNLPGDILASYDLPDDYFRTSTNALSKLINFQFLRGDVEASLHVNAPPSAKGIIALIVVPQVPEEQTSILRYWSGFPHSLLNIGGGDQTSIVAPFTHHLNWSQVAAYSGPGDPDSKKYFQFARLYVMCFAALNISTVDCNMFLRMRNVKVKMPTLPTAILPSGKGKHPLIQGPGKIKIKVRGKPIKYDKHPLQQSGESSVKSTDSTEQSSQFLEGVNRATKTVSSLAKTALEVFSKPATKPAIVTVKEQGGRHMPHGQDTFNGTVMGLDQGTQSIPPIIDMKAMNIAHICSHRYLENVFTFTTSQASGDIIAHFLVNPASYVRGPSTDTWLGGALDYVANAFSFWRGGLDFKPVFATNPFFSGKLEFIFVPGDPSVRTSISNDEANQVYSVVVDLRDKEPPAMRIPFVSPTPWRPVRPNFDNVDGNPTFSDGCTGVLYVRVLNPLKVMNTDFGTSVDCLMFKSAAPDIEFSYPCQKGYITQPSGVNGDFQTWTTVPGPSMKQMVKNLAMRTSKHPSDIPQIQSGGNDGVYMMDDPDPGIISMFESVPRSTPSGGCMGEKVTNIRELCTRSCYFGEIANNSTTAVVSDTIRGNFTGNALTWMTYFMHLFAYYHSSIRYDMNIASITFNAGSVGSGGFGTVAVELWTNWGAVGNNDPPSPNGTPLVFLGQEGVGSIEVPWTVPTFYAPTRQSTAFDKDGSTFSPHPVLSYKWRYARPGTLDERHGLNLGLCMSAGDDCVLQYQVAPPPVFVAVDSATSLVFPPDMGYFEFQDAQS